MSTTWRQDIRSAMLVILDGIQTANPEKLRRVWRARPASYTGETPLAYVGRLEETWRHDSGTRVRVITGEVVFIDTLAESTETTDRVDVLVDLVCDAFTAHPHIGTGEFEGKGVRDEEERQGPAPLSATSVHFEATIQEGRS